MVKKSNPEKISEILKLNRIIYREPQLHLYLEDDDLKDISYLWEYVLDKGYEGGYVNSLILNLKKSPKNSDKYEYHYKLDAIKEIAEKLSRLKSPMENYTIIPVPPSKCKDDAGYDDRLIQILHQWKELNPKVQYKELILQNNSTNPSHLSNQRLSPQELINNYRFNDGIKQEEIRNNILIFDDILTTGSHYSAIKSLLKEKFPQKQIKGFFLTKSTITTD